MSQQSPLQSHLSRTWTAGPCETAKPHLMPRKKAWESATPTVLAVALELLEEKHIMHATQCHNKAHYEATSAGRGQQAHAKHQNPI